MTQIVVWEGRTGRNAGIILKCSQKVSGGQKLFLEILFPADTVLPEAGNRVMIPPGRKGTVVHCRVTGRNGSFLRFIAEVRLRKPGPRGQTTPE